MQNARLINFTATLIALIAVGYILYVGSAILLPFIVAIVIWYIIITLAELIKKIHFGNFYLPSILALLLSLCFTYVILHFMVLLIMNSIIGLIQEAPRYQAKFISIIHFMNQKFDLNYNSQMLLSKLNLTSFFTNITLALTSLAQNLFLIIIYVLFLLLEYHTFNDKLKGVIKNKRHYQQVDHIVHKIKSSINAYILLKTGISFLTAFFSYLVLIAFNVANPLFWALLIFLLNYIPTIGSIVAIGLLLMVAAIEFSELYTYLGLAAALIGVQLLFGNIIEPKFTGSKLNLSPVVILLSLAFWGSIWGIIGMFLCVPLMTIANIVLFNFEKTKPIAIILSSSYDPMENS